MNKVRIGRSDLEVRPINLGGNVFGCTLGEAQSFSNLDAFDKGGNFIDTGDVPVKEYLGAWPWPGCRPRPAGLARDF